MNKTKIRKVAVALLNGTLATRKRGEKIGFNLAPFYYKSEGEMVHIDRTGHGCGSTACIAGWAHFLEGGRAKNASTISMHAREILGLDIERAEQLFAPMDINRSAVTPQQAAFVLFNLAETGKVDWSITGAQA